MAESRDRERTVWFYRDNQRMNGANLKHSHYLEHVQRTPGFSPKITFGGEPLNEELICDRPLWPTSGVPCWEPGRHDVLFLDGVEDWRYLVKCGLESLPNPRINLILGGPRQRALRRGRGHEAAIRLRPAEPDAGGARGEPAPEEREGRRGVAAAGKPVLVRGPGRGGQAQAPAHRGRARGESPGGGLVAVRLDRDDGGRRAGGGGAAGGARPGRGRRAAALGHERERAHHLPRGARSRHRPGAARSPGLALHARRRRGRRGVRVKARTGAHDRQPGDGGGDS